MKLELLRTEQQQRLEHFKTRLKWKKNTLTNNRQWRHNAQDIKSQNISYKSTEVIVTGELSEGFKE